MSIRTVSLTILSVIVVIVLAQAALAQEPVKAAAVTNDDLGICIKKGSKTQAMKDVDTGLETSWSRSRPYPDEYVEIDFCIGDDGKIYEPVIAHQSKDSQYNAECLEALCSLSPVSSTSSNSTCQLQHGRIRFGEKKADGGFEPKYDGSDSREYLRSHPQPSNPDAAFVVVHRIPLTILSRYPNYFTKDEIISPNNLIEIRTDAADTPPGYIRRIGNLYAYWAQLFAEQNVTKEQILHRAQKGFTEMHAQ